jgi:hypothetical protein
MQTQFSLVQLVEVREFQPYDKLLYVARRSISLEHVIDWGWAANLVIHEKYWNLHANQTLNILRYLFLEKTQIVVVPY